MISNTNIFTPPRYPNDLLYYTHFIFYSEDTNTIRKVISLQLC